MIVAERKPIKEILAMIADFKKILILGCNACVTVCSAGGQKEAEILGSIIRMARKKEGKPIEIDERVVERQCEPGFLDVLGNDVNDFDAVLSMACGAGVQAVAERFPDSHALPALNTEFIGVTVERGVWSERCMACGNCVLDKTFGICPVTRCAKGLLNGPCGGSQQGKCEISKDIPCAWVLIYDRMKKLADLKELREFVEPKDNRRVRVHKLGIDSPKG
jgi:ferredoxin